MCLTTFLPDLRHLTLEAVTGDADHLTVVATARAPTAVCPLCQQPSSRVHSNYWRMLTDRDPGHLAGARAAFLLYQPGLCAHDLL
jgi:hypothetical protein